MGKVNSHNTVKVWEKTNIQKLWVSQIFWMKQKYGKSEFTEYGKSVGKQRFPLFFASSQIWSS